MGGRIWTDEELEFIKENFYTMTNNEMAKILGREYNAVQLKVNKMGLKGDNGRKPRRRDTYRGELPKINDEFGMLTVKQVVEKYGYTACICECKCSPGNTFERNAKDLKQRNNHSCGCQKIEKAVKRLTTHDKTGHPIYKIWHSMKKRCYNPNHESYAEYGGRGICICEEWHNFQTFYNWAIEKYEKGKTIHRIDNNKGYEPSNCVWATPKRQANERRNNHKITAFGETKNITQWAEDKRCMVNVVTLFSRINQLGWDEHEAVTTPPLRQKSPA